MTKLRISPLLALAAFFLILSFHACKPDQAATKWKHNDNTVRVRIAANISTLNPFTYRTSIEATAYELMYQYLMGFEMASLKMVPQLVKTAAVVNPIQGGEFDGGQSFTYEILAEATWDDGKPVTGHDFDFTLKAVFNPKMPTQRFLSYIEMIRDIEVDANNPKLFTVFTNNKYFLAEAGISNFIVLPAHFYDPEGLMKNFTLKDLTDPAKAAVLSNDPKLQQFADGFTSPKFTRETFSGSGPYQLAEWVDGQRIVLAKKKNWWGDKLASQYPLLAAYPDTIIFMPNPDQPAAIAALKDEAYDVALDMDSKLFNELKTDTFASSVFDFHSPTKMAFFYTAMNNKNPKLADKRVRQALARLIDMDLVVRDVYDGLGERVAGPFLPEQPYYAKDLKLISFDVEGAKKLLDEAGWKDSNGNGILDKTLDGKLTELKLQVLYSPGSTLQENFTELLKNSAQKAGIEIERVQVEANLLGERLRNRDFELAGRGGGMTPTPDDPKQLFHTDSDNPGGSNYSRFGNAESDALIEAIRNAPDQATRNGLYLKFQQLIYDEQPMIFWFSPMERIAAHKRFEAETGRKSPGISLQKLKLRETPSLRD